MPNPTPKEESAFWKSIKTWFWRILFILLMLYLLIGPVFNIVYHGVKEEQWTPRAVDFNPLPFFTWVKDGFNSIFSTKEVSISPTKDDNTVTITKPENTNQPTTPAKLILPKPVTSCTDECKPSESYCKGNIANYCNKRKEDNCFHKETWDCSKSGLTCTKGDNGYTCLPEAYSNPAPSNRKWLTYGLRGVGIIVLIISAILIYHKLKSGRNRTRRGPPPPPPGAGAADRTGAGF